MGNIREERKIYRQWSMSPRHPHSHPPVSLDSAMCIFDWKFHKVKLMPIRSCRYLVVVAILAATYFGIGKLALSIPTAVPTVTPLYPPAGISQAALFLLGLGFWPGVAVGDFLVCLAGGLPPLTAVGIAAIASLQAIAGVTLLRRFKIKPPLERLQDAIGFVILSAILSTAIAPTLGVSLLCLTNIYSWSNFGPAWWTWWLGDGMGVLVVTPLLLTWCRGKLPKRLSWPRIKEYKRYADAAILLILPIAVTWIVFTSQIHTAISRYPLEYLPFPLLIWIAVRFGQRGSTLAIFIFCGIAVWGAGQGYGPFFQRGLNPTEAILSLQVFIAVIDITALLLAASIAECQAVAHSLRQSQASLTEAQRIAYLGSWNFDLIKQKWYWSEQLYSILGFSPQAFQCDRDIFLRSVHPEEKSWVKQSFMDALKHQKSYSINFRIIRPNGDERIVREQAEIILDGAGMPIRITGTVQDITKQKRVEQALIESESQLLELAQNLDYKVRLRTEELEQKNQELAESLKTIQETQQQLIQSEKMSSLGQLVAGIAHEINNPVNFIYANISHAREYTQALFDLVDLYQKDCGYASTEVKDYIELIDLEFMRNDLPRILSSMLTGSERIRQIVLSLRNFSRLDESRMKPIDIHEGIDSTLLLLQQRLKGRHGNTNINVVKQYGSLPLVECYPGELNQVFMNLLTNAIDAIDMVEGTKMQVGAIAIQTQILKTNSVLIKISDTGMGMTEDVKSRIFDPFFTTKPVGKGTGLGLSISYQIIVHHHKGQIKCISKLGKGTEFHIEIPLWQTC